MASNDTEPAQQHYISAVVTGARGLRVGSTYTARIADSSGCCPPSTDPIWARELLCRTTQIVTGWHHHTDRHSFIESHFEQLHVRWDTRAQTLTLSGSAPSLVVMPRAINLAEILCDPPWRRHVAIADRYDLMLFYRQVARRLGQPTTFSDRLAYSHQIDPLKSWVIEQRKQFRTCGTSTADSVVNTPTINVSLCQPPDKPPPHAARHEGHGR